jgi:hypothetical protein
MKNDLFFYDLFFFLSFFLSFRNKWSMVSIFFKKKVLCTHAYTLIANYYCYYYYYSPFLPAVAGVWWWQLGEYTFFFFSFSLLYRKLAVLQVFIAYSEQIVERKAKGMREVHSTCVVRHCRSISTVEKEKREKEKAILVYILVSSIIHTWLFTSRARSFQSYYCSIVD